MCNLNLYVGNNHISIHGKTHGKTMVSCKCSHQNQWFPQEPRDALTAAAHPIEGPRSAAEAQDLQGLGDPASVFVKKTQRGSWAILMWKYVVKESKMDET